MSDSEKLMPVYSTQLKDYAPSCSGRPKKVWDMMHEICPYGFAVGMVGHMGFGKSSLVKAAALALGMDDVAAEIATGNLPCSLTQNAFSLHIKENVARIVDMSGMSHQNWISLGKGTIPELAKAAETAGPLDEARLTYNYRRAVCERLEAFFRGLSSTAGDKEAEFDWTDPVPTSAPSVEFSLRHKLSGFIVVCNLKNFADSLWVGKGPDGEPALVLKGEDGLDNDFAHALARIRALRQHCSAASKCESMAVFTGLDVLEQHAACARGKLGETLSNPQKNIDTLKQLIVDAVGPSHTEFIDTSDVRKVECQEQAAKIFLRALRNCERGVEAQARAELARREGEAARAAALV